MGLAHALYTCPTATGRTGRAQGSAVGAEEAARQPTATTREHMRTLKSLPVHSGVPEGVDLGGTGCDVLVTSDPPPPARAAGPWRVRGA